VRDPLRAQLTQGITPRKIALTLAIGGSCALFPILGTTTLLCFLAALILRLNQPIIHLVNQALWPVQLSVIYFCIRLGENLVGAEHLHSSLTHLNQLFWNDPAQFFHEFGATLLHAIIGWVVVAPFFSMAIYWLALPILRGMNRLEVRSRVQPSLSDPPHA